MNPARVITSLVPAGIVTAGLLLTMHILILQNLEEPSEGEEFKLPDITMPDQQITTEYDTSKPDKPEQPDEPPPELPEPEFENLEADTSLSVSPNLGAKLDIGGIGGFSSDGDYLPIVKPAPKYPSRAAARGIEGYCTVEYTVTKTGETRDIVVVDCPNKIFSSSSVKAAAKFKYKPKVIDGEAIEVPGVRNRFTFQMGQQ
ncbi:energy transducer TonB [Agarilytica rhodophyticola]|uniref:energy transducer TonB n=1 Tax=Agarilytica rhodophyticola TaxID=1737490 RepID=UPI000B3419E8|nr:energy transducer TonB [Agarilytica rhodophyticola]